MAWLKLTLQDGRKNLVNTDQVSEVWAAEHSAANAGIRQHDGVTLVRETVDEINEMIERDAWRERVLRVACAIMSNEHANGLTSEQVWARAARFAAMDPEQEAFIKAI
jgi:hypothetical protein